MTHSRRIPLLAAVLLLGTAPEAFAQKATLEGILRTEDGGAPVQFALVRLVHGNSIRHDVLDVGGTIWLDSATFSRATDRAFEEVWPR